MRQVNYKILLPVGDSEIETESSLVDFLLDTLYLLSHKRIPPMNVLNSHLSQGICDRGMSRGVKWTPFVINSTEYMELADALMQMEQGYFIDDEIPATKDMESWSILAWSRCDGVDQNLIKTMLDDIEKRNQRISRNE